MFEPYDDIFMCLVYLGVWKEALAEMVVGKSRVHSVVIRWKKGLCLCVGMLYKTTGFYFIFSHLQSTQFFCNHGSLVAETDRAVNATINPNTLITAQFIAV